MAKKAPNCNTRSQKEKRSPFPRRGGVTCCRLDEKGQREDGCRDYFRPRSSVVFRPIRSDQSEVTKLLLQPSVHVKATPGCTSSSILRLPVRTPPPEDRAWTSSSFADLRPLPPSAVRGEKKVRRKMNGGTSKASAGSSSAHWHHLLNLCSADKQTGESLPPRL